MIKINFIITIVFLLLILPILCFGQAGSITYPSPTTITVLNPDGDGWTTTSSAAFISNEESESELNWIPAFQLTSEPTSDNNPGGPCGNIDIVDVSGLEKAGYYTIVDPDGISATGDEHFCFRLRIGSDPGTGNFGFSVFLDIDNTFGGDNSCVIDDPDAIDGNLGFEVEIRVVNGGGAKGVYLDDVNGLVAGINKASYSLSTNTHKVVAKYGLTCTTPMFYDFSIPVADLTTYFGINETIPVRMAFMTTTNGTTALGDNAADIGGVDDLIYLNDDDALSDLICGQAAIPLPIKLLSFNAKKNSSLVDVNWTTSTEINNDFFTVEKSKDGILFEIVGVVEGAGNSYTQKNYQLFDDNPYSGVSYYRLKQTDTDGNYSYSNIVSINFNNDDDIISFYPNPADNSLHYNIAPSQIEIFDLAGKLVLFAKPINSTTHIGHLSSGIYMTKIEYKGNTRQEKLIIK
jgi:hypothetical protein